MNKKIKTLFIKGIMNTRRRLRDIDGPRDMPFISESYNLYFKQLKTPQQQRTR